MRQSLREAEATITQRSKAAESRWSLDHICQSQQISQNPKVTTTFSISNLNNLYKVDGFSVSASTAAERGDDVASAPSLGDPRSPQLRQSGHDQQFGLALRQDILSCQLPQGYRILQRGAHDVDNQTGRTDSQGTF